MSEEGELAVTVSGGDTVPAQFVGRDPTTDVAFCGLTVPTCGRFPLRQHLSRSARSP